MSDARHAEIPSMGISKSPDMRPPNRLSVARWFATAGVGLAATLTMGCACISRVGVESAPVGAQVYVRGDEGGYLLASSEGGGRRLRLRNDDDARQPDIQLGGPRQHALGGG